jgi:hypothetical protein
MSIVLLNPSRSQSITTGSEELDFKRIFLAHLFDLIAFLCECGGDFMVDRIKSSVLPVVQAWLLHFQQRPTRPSQPQAPGLELSFFIQDEGASSLSIYPANSDTLKLRNSERRLLFSITRGLTRILRQDDCGTAMLSTLPEVILMVLPLLEFDDDVELHLCVMDCLKCILEIDCDTMRRALLDLSGCGVPTCPIQAGIDTDGKRNIALVKIKLSTRVLTPAFRNLNLLQAKKCNEILLYAETLAEQRLL